MKLAIIGSRDLIKISIKKNKKFNGFNWKYKYE